MSTFQMVLFCATCRTQKLVMIFGWDIKKVTHDCEARTFNVEYDPPRSVY